MEGREGEGEGGEYWDGIRGGFTVGFGVGPAIYLYSHPRSSPLHHHHHNRNYAGAYQYTLLLRYSKSVGFFLLYLNSPRTRTTIHSINLRANMARRRITNSSRIQFTESSLPSSLRSGSITTTTTFAFYDLLPFFLSQTIMSPFPVLSLYVLFAYYLQSIPRNPIQAVPHPSCARSPEYILGHRLPPVEFGLSSLLDRYVPDPRNGLHVFFVVEYF